MFRRIIAPLALLLILAAAGAALLWRRPAGPGTGPRPAAPPAVARHGGTITATMRGEPPTLNRFASPDFPTHLLSLLTHARLVQIDPQTDDPVLWLAESLSLGETTLEVNLRPGLRFSDGTPLTSGDVVWSLAAAYGTAGGGVGDVLRIGGEEMRAEAASPTRVVFHRPGPWATAVRVLDALPIYPRASIEPALGGGTFAAACGMASPCPGLGPFVVARYDAGQRVVLARNPHYWRKDRAGRALPFLDGLTLEIVPDQNAELLRLAAGEVDVLQGELRPEDIRTLRPHAEAGRVVLTDVGPGLDRHVLWFNLGPGPVAPGRAFLREDDFRQAVSLAVDRRGLADTVFLGAAEPSPEPMPRVAWKWRADDLPLPAYEPARAAALLEGLGLKDRDNDGLREDAAGRPVRFSVLAQSGITAAGAAAGFLRDALANIGVGVDVVTLDLGAVMNSWKQGRYDAILHYMQMSDTDPAANLDFWLSRGGSHLWHPEQTAPATPWEAEIDRRMLAMAAMTDRQARAREFAEVQRLMLTHNPAIWFAAPRVFVATRPRVGGVQPRLTRPQVLWKADELFLKP